MKISKWVDVGAEVEIEIGVDDIRGALGEEFSGALRDKLGEGDNKQELLRALNSIAMFLNAIDQAHIDSMTFSQRLVIEKYLRSAADRFKLPAEAV